ncbi:MAG: disulfide bond formation protein B [Gammaproteobacteria bacterium]|nr:disulfide bond formation protein B [Gammaproteobacteria bacterium]
MPILTPSFVRRCHIAAALAAVALIAVALYFQYVMNLEPCPLCIFQRVAVMALGVWAGVAAAINPMGWGRRVVGVVTVLLAIAGGAVAGRQVWLQHLPEDQVPACGPGLDYMLDMFPMRKVLDLVFRGSGECAEVHWTFLGMSIAEWMLVVFSGFLAFGILIAFARVRRS